MNNLLPTIKKTITHRAEDKNQSWRPADAHPITGKVSYFLESEFTKESTIKITYGQNVLPMKPPNEKHADLALYTQKDMSPLKSAMQDVMDITKVIFIPPPSLTRKTIIKDTSCGNCLILRMINTLPMCMDLFVQKKLTISTTTVLPMRQCKRLIAGTEDEIQKEDEACFWFSSSKRAVLSTTNRQELKDFTFSTSLQIGLEVELVEERLVVTQVLPDCQASPHQVALLSAELVAVNGSRVINMNEFREAMVLAKEKSEVVLQVASYKGGKGKMDTLYSHDFTKSKEVKSLLSNIMMHGLDAEHHRGITSGGSSTADTAEEEEADTAEGEDQSRSPSRTGLPMTESFSRPITSEGWEHLEEYPDIDDGGGGEYLDTFDEGEDGGLRARRRVRTSESTRARSPAKEDSGPEGGADGDDDSVGSNDSWNKLTKVEEIVSRRSLVCYPPQLGASLQWGVPAKFLQVSNYSTTWKLEVHWVNEDSILIRRAEIPGGNTDYQLFDLDHVWCVTATAVVKDHHHGHHAHNYFTNGAALGTEIASEAEEGSPAMLTFRPSKYSLSNNKCTSILWSPYVSMSITQRVYLSSKASMEEPSAVIAGVANPPNFTSTPHMHIQVFDGVNKTAPLPGHGHSMVRPLSGDQVTLDRIKLPKWPRKSNGKRERALRGRK